MRFLSVDESNRSSNDSSNGRLLQSHSDGIKSIREDIKGQTEINGVVVEWIIDTRHGNVTISNCLASSPFGCNEDEIRVSKNELK